MFPTGGHNGCDADLIDTIFKGDHPRTMVTKFYSKSTPKDYGYQVLF
jgi:hypothetical protein